MTAEFKRKEASHRAEGKRLARELNDLAERLAKFNASEFVKGPARRRGVRAAAALRRADEQTREYVLQIEGLYNRLPAHLQRIGLYLKLTQKKSCITPEVRAETDFYLVALYLYIRHVTGAKRFFHREVEALIYAGQEAFGKEKPPSNPDTFRIDFSRYRRRWPVHYDALDHLTAQYFRLDSNRRGSSYGHWLLSRWRARLTRTF